MRKLKHEEIPRHTADELKDRAFHPILCVLDNIRSAENVGSIFRSADAFRIEELILTGITPTPAKKNLHRSALGAQDIVPWRSQDMKTTIQLVDALKEQAYTIAALEICDISTEPKRLSQNNFPLCIILGNEIDGVSEELMQRCDLAFEIPQYGFKQSLNVAVATGICLAEAVARYRELAADRDDLVSDPRD